TLYIHHALAPQLTCLRPHGVHIRHVPMTDIRTEHPAEARAEGIRPGVECRSRNRVVSLAPKVEMRHEQVADVLLALDTAALEFVDCLAILADPEEVDSIARVAVFGHSSFEALEQAAEHFAVQVGGIVVLDRGAVALFPMADQIAVQASSPTDAALQEREFQLRKAPRDAAQEQRLAYRLARRAEMADMIVHVIR